MITTTMILGTMYIFLHEMEDGEISSRDLTMTFTTFVMFDMFNALVCRHNSRPIYELSWSSNKFFLLALLFSLTGQFLVIYLTPLQHIFRTVSLSINDLIFVIFMTSSMLLLDIIRKKYFSTIFTEMIPMDHRVISKLKMINNNNNVGGNSSSANSSGNNNIGKDHESVAMMV